MKSPDFEVKTTVSGDFNNHKTKYKAINSAGYNFSGTTIQSRIVAELVKEGDGEFPERRARDLLKKGEGRYWQTQRGANNAKIFTLLPGFYGLSTYICASNRQTGFGQISGTYEHALEDAPQTRTNTGSDGLTGGVSNPKNRKYQEVSAEEEKIKAVKPKKAPFKTLIFRQIDHGVNHKSHCCSIVQ